VARGRRTAQRRTPKDWVYHPQGYSGIANALSNGVLNPTAVPLTISQNSRKVIVGGAAGADPGPGVDSLPRWSAIPEGSKTRVYAVQGTVLFSISDLAVGSFYQLGCRLVHAEQDPDTQQMLAPAGYSMMVGTVEMTLGDSANIGFLWERRRNDLTSSVAGVVSRAMFRIDIAWYSKRGLTLGNDRAIYLWLETIAGSNDMTFRSYVRVLMASPANL